MGLEERQVRELALSCFLLKEVDRDKILRIDSVIENTTTFACVHVGLCNLEMYTVFE